jgi:hypothetical protein
MVDFHLRGRRASALSFWARSLPSVLCLCDVDIRFRKLRLSPRICSRYDSDTRDLKSNSTLLFYC